MNVFGLKLPRENKSAPRQELKPNQGENKSAPLPEFNLFNLLQKNWAKISKLLLTFGFLIYLVGILTGSIDKSNKRLQPPELGLAAILFLINSDIFDRLQELQLNKDGWDLKLGSKVEANVMANQKEARALTYLGAALLTEDKKEDQTRQFFDILLDDGERDLLEELYRAEVNNKELPYEKSVINKPLRHLAVLGFIDNLSVLTKCQIDYLPERGDLRQYFKLSDTGRKCLAFGSSKVLQVSALGLQTSNRIIRND